ncbi:MAG: hypothetical protein DRJ65_09045 [Acidobacteria bacterium]|nr:MAG: hypothetical protein DRJ65_09045 [Acidobacteriota bacterium]
MRLMNKVLLILGLVLSSVVGPANSAVREFFGSDSFVVSDGKQVVVNVWDVDVFVRAADTPMVRCTTDLRIAGTGAEKADQWIAARVPKFIENDKGLILSLDPGEEGFLGIGAFTRRRRMGLLIPHPVTPDLTTSSGTINVDGDFPAADPLRLRTGSGSISLDGAAKSLEIRTTSGKTEVRVVRPLDRFWVRTSSGSISLTGGALDVEVETASGDVELAALSGSAVVTSVGGTLDLDWDHLGPDAVVTIRSLKGDITVTLPHSIRPRGVLTTTSGAIKSDFPGEVNEKGDTVTLVGDGPRLEIETASGAILLQADRGWFAP